MIYPELVIFDCDGVLIDSEGLAHQVLVDALAEQGVSMTLEEALSRYVGISEGREHVDVEARYGVKLPASFIERKRQIREKLFKEQLKPIAGINEFIDILKSRKCVASGSSPERLQHSMGLVNLWDKFAPHIFSATQVEHGKPAPDLFLFAAQQMGASPAACLVIEDSVAGVQAAKAAGMKVFGFTGGSHCGVGHGEVLLREGAAAVFGHMDDVARALVPVAA